MICVECRRPIIASLRRRLRHPACRDRAKDHRRWVRRNDEPAHVIEARLRAAEAWVKAQRRGAA